jgi:tetratricopeptide (TPR) repeat protein
MPTIEQLERLLAADPGDAFVLYGLAQEYAKAGAVDKAVEYFDRCLGSDPGYCYAYYHKARVLSGAGRGAEALVALRSGLEAARKARDSHALAEMQALLDELG